VGVPGAARSVRTRVHLRASLLGVPAASAAVIESLPLRIFPMTRSRLRELQGSRGRLCLVGRASHPRGRPGCCALGPHEGSPVGFAPRCPGGKRRRDRIPPPLSDDPIAAPWTARFAGPVR